jgi:hypothetical protein
MLIPLMPLRRYVVTTCCKDPDHIANIADPEYKADLNTDLETVEDILLAWGQQHALVHFRGAALSQP